MTGGRTGERERESRRVCRAAVLCCLLAGSSVSTDDSTRSSSWQHPPAPGRSNLCAAQHSWGIVDLRLNCKSLQEETRGLEGTSPNPHALLISPTQTTQAPFPLISCQIHKHWHDFLYFGSISTQPITLAYNSIQDLSNKVLSVRATKNFTESVFMMHVTVNDVCEWTSRQSLQVYTVYLQIGENLHSGQRWRSKNLPCNHMI